MATSSLRLALALAMAQGAAVVGGQSSHAPALTPVFHAGERYANVFSRTIDVRAEGFGEDVRRTSGSAEYRVIEGGSPQRLHIDYRYDGRPPGSGTVQLRDEGATTCYDGTCSANTDGSGLAFNPRLWGVAPAKLRVGQHWTVDIRQPWELGPPGRQTVTVVAFDPADLRVTLRREGSGEGAYLDDRPTATLVRDGQSHVFRVLPGRSHWSGYTTFRAGIVVSDELLVERAVTLVSDKLGRVAGQEREYILLDAAP
jgi:hypothetical protein